MFRSSLALAGRKSLCCIISQHFVLGFYEADVVKAPLRKNVLKFFGSFWP